MTFRETVRTNVSAGSQNDSLGHSSVKYDHQIFYVVLYTDPKIKWVKKEGRYILLKRVASRLPLPDFRIILMSTQALIYSTLAMFKPLIN